MGQASPFQPHCIFCGRTVLTAGLVPFIKRTKTKERIGRGSELLLPKKR